MFTSDVQTCSSRERIANCSLSSGLWRGPPPATGWRAGTCGQSDCCCGDQVSDFLSFQHFLKTFHLSSCCATEGEETLLCRHLTSKVCGHPACRLGSAHPRMSCSDTPALCSHFSRPQHFRGPQGLPSIPNERGCVERGQGEAQGVTFTCRRLNRHLSARGAYCLLTLHLETEQDGTESQPGPRVGMHLPQALITPILSLVLCPNCGVILIIVTPPHPRGRGLVVWLPLDGRPSGWRGHWETD